MAAWLTWLKSRLLLPKGAEPDEAEEAADVLAARLAELRAMRAAAAWLSARPTLGQDVFGRGAPEDFSVVDRSKLALDVGGLLRGYVSALRRGAGTKPYRPPGVSLWSVQQALTRLAALVGGLPDWSTLETYLPEDMGTPLERRGALASTLLAGLEMARGGAMRLRQEAAFGPILVRGGGEDG
jgi:segregation and condensation protein A